MTERDVSNRSEPGGSQPPGDFQPEVPVCQAWRLGVTWFGVCVALVAIFVRCSVALYPLPMWDTDPLELPPVPSGIGPFESILLDLFSMLALLLVLAGNRLTIASLGLLSLWFVGASGVVYHGWLESTGDLENIRLGLSWASAWSGGLALYIACANERIRTIAGAALIGFVGVLAARGVLQFFIEHQETVRTFRETSERFFAARGWDPDSQLALTYERRLNQAEATGWFGLSNVYGSVVGASFVAILAWTLESIRAWRREPEILTSGWVGLLAAGAFTSGTALFLSNSRGAWGAAIVGVAIFVVWRFGLARLSRPNWAVKIALAAPIALVLVAPLLIAIHGQLGDSALDLSLRFRWFYMRTAAAILWEHPTFGVGPGDFQDAYMIHKPALSPESVASPHSYSFDLASTLGLAGVAWIALLLAMLAGLGRALARPVDTSISDARLARSDFWLLLAITALPALASGLTELAETTPDRAIARLLGLGIWFGVALAAVFLMRAAPVAQLAIPIAALTVTLHAQIEVTGVAFGAAHWFVAALGIGAAHAPVAPRKRRRIAKPVAIGVVALATAVCIPAALLPAQRWQRALTNAAEAVGPITEIRTRMRTLSGPGARSLGQVDTIDRLSADLGALLGIQPPRTQDEFERALLELQVDRTGAALIGLRGALGVFPSHLGVGSAYSRLALQRAELLAGVGREVESAAHAELAVAVATQSASENPNSPAAWARLGGLLAYLASEPPLGEVGEARTLYRESIAAYERAAELDPHGLAAPVRLASLHAEAGNDEEARRWARIALEINENLHLDPLVQLTDRQRQELDRLLSLP